MNVHPEHIANEFADVFEWAYLNEELDIQSYLCYRDDFYQVVRSELENDIESPAEVEERFQRPPVLFDDVLMSFAAGNAEYYTRILGLPAPTWCNEIPPLDESIAPIFPFPRLLNELDDIIADTPPELRNRGFIYAEHNFDIY